MTDKERYIELYFSFGIIPIEDSNINGSELIIECDQSNNVKGYSFFKTVAYFDKNDKFIEMYICE